MGKKPTETAMHKRFIAELPQRYPMRINTPAGSLTPEQRLLASGSWVEVRPDSGAGHLFCRLCQRRVVAWNGRPKT